MEYWKLPSKTILRQHCREVAFPFLLLIYSSTPNSFLLSRGPEPSGLTAQYGSRSKNPERYWHKNRHDHQWNRTEDPDMKPHNYNQLVFEKGAKNTW
jgi:hypothetical protein